MIFRGCDNILILKNKNIIKQNSHKIFTKNKKCDINNESFY